MISVVIPLYNKEMTIKHSLSSVLSQDYDDIEVIVVNDGSTDNSVEVVKSINDSRIVVIEQENGGPSKARNTGIRNAKGEWLVTLDADDELVEHALSKMIRETEKYRDADIIDFVGYIRSGEELTRRYHPLKGRVKVPLKALYYRQISPSSGHAIIRTSFVKRHLYDERIRRFEDYELELRMLPEAILYSSQEITEIHNVDYAEASNARKDIMEDFMGYIDMSKGGFWYKLCVYRTFLEERDNYEKVCKEKYANLYKRYDLLLLHKVLQYINGINKK